MSTFGWCQSGDHDACKRSFERAFTEKRGKVETLVKTGEVVYCECPKRGCKCHAETLKRKKTK